MSFLINCVFGMYLLVCALGVEEQYVIRLGFLGDSSLEEEWFSRVVCSARWWERKIVIERTTLTYEAGNITSLRKAVQNFVYQTADIMIARITFVDFNYLHGVLHHTKCLETSDVSKFHVSEWLWYVNLRKGTSTCGPAERLARSTSSNKKDVAAFLVDVVRNVGWKYASMLYESDYGEEASVITDLLSENGVRINQHHIEPNKSSLRFIEHSYSMMRDGWRQYLLLAHWTTVDIIFEQLNAFDASTLGETAMRTYSQWLVWGSNVTSGWLEERVANISNVAVLEMFDYPDQGTYHTQPYNPNLLRNTCELLAKSDADNCTHEGDLKAHVSRLGNAIWKSVSLHSIPRPQFMLSTAMWKPDGRRFQTVYDGYRGHLRAKLRDIFPNTQYGLNNMLLYVSTLPWPMYATKYQRSDGTVYYEGLSMDLLQAMSRKLNFSYILQEPEDQEWGRRLNGNWTGLIGDLVYGRADMVAAPLSTQNDRNEVIDFTTPFITDYNVIMTKMPDKEKTRWMLLLRPLDWSVLVTIASIFPAVSVCLWVCERFSPFYNDISRRRKIPGLQLISECMWYMLGALFTRSGIYLPKAHSGRTIVIFWWLFIVLLVATYCGHLMAYLAVSRERKPFNTIAELTKLPQFKWGTNNGTYLVEIMKTSTEPDYRALWQGIERFTVEDPWVLHLNYNVHMKAVSKGDYAYLTDETTIDMATAKDCSLVRADETFLMLQYCVTLRNNSAYTNLFSQSVTAIVEAGLIEMWRKRWWPKSAPCPSFLKAEARQIMLADIQSSFYILFGGISLAGFVLTVEMSCMKWKLFSGKTKKDS